MLKIFDNWCSRSMCLARAWTARVFVPDAFLGCSCVCAWRVPGLLVCLCLARAWVTRVFAPARVLVPGACLGCSCVFWADRVFWAARVLVPGVCLGCSFVCAWRVPGLLVRLCLTRLCSCVCVWFVLTRVIMK